MERLKDITIIFLLAVGLLTPVVLAKSASTLLQEGLYAEEVDGDIDAAIRIYGQVIADTSVQRSHTAQAMYRQGMCYLKKQNEQQAKEVFEKLVANYSDQTKIISKVKPILDELGNADPAALMPPETLIYVETGSPGRQIETILNMLKGTPFENPLAVLGGGRGFGPGGKSPGDIMAALMNPAMMAEFKKIRGMGVGITGVAQNNPPVIAVLFPGKSDALRGLILAALGMIGTPGEAIEGMQSVVFPDGGGAAYDDTTVIVASPAAYSAGQLAWSVRQYKGVTSKPTLASSNKSFAKVSKKARQENALTLWANVDEVFAGLSNIIPAEHMPAQIRLADGIADFRNIDDLIVFFNIQENGITLEENIAFKDGHRCLAYDMIRTPNLSRAGFEAVPPDAIGLLSFALGEAASVQGMAASKKIEHLTGLDIGREIFANIEQITLFVLPPDSVSGQSNNGLPPVVNNLGLAITSHNPQQTRRLLTRMLTVANLVTGRSPAGGQPEQGIGKYQIGLANNQQLYCYMNQMSKTTVLSLNPDVVETSVSAIKRRRSVCTAGPLQEAMSKLSTTTSKLVLVNVGGVIRVVDDYLNTTYDNPQNPGHKILAQLAQAFDKTSVQLCTDERLNNYNARLSIDQLPPLDNVFPPLMQLSQMDPTAKAKATKPGPRNGATVGQKTVSQLKWKPGANAKSHKVYFGTQIDEASMAEVQTSSYSDIPDLKEGTKYYWRVDEVWADGTVITGDVWSFTIGKQVARWKLDEAGGNTATDSVGNNNGRVIGNPQWKPSAGKIGGAMEFDGDGDYVEIGRESNFDIADQITVSAWIKVNQFDKEWQAVIAKGDSAWRIQRNQNNNSLEFACSGLKIPSGAPWGNLYGEKNVNDGKWHHIAGIYDGNKMYLIIDGDVDTSQPASGRINTNDQPVYIGENSENTGRYWNGLIDDVRIYNYALSERNVKTLYEEGK